MLGNLIGMRRFVLKRLRLFAIFFLVVTASPLPGLLAADWVMDAWRVEEGLPDNIVDAITQTPDGYLWLGTQGGLVRFDGVRFSPVDDPGLKIQRIHQLHVDRLGRLW